MDAEVRFSPSGTSVRVARGTTLWKAVRSAGLPVASACGAHGICGRCGVMVLEGGESLAPESAREADVKTRNRVDPKQRLSCRVAVNGDLLITANYW